MGKILEIIRTSVGEAVVGGGSKQLAAGGLHVGGERAQAAGRADAGARVGRQSHLQRLRPRRLQRLRALRRRQRRHRRRARVQPLFAPPAHVRLWASFPAIFTTLSSEHAAGA